MKNYKLFLLILILFFSSELISQSIPINKKNLHTYFEEVWTKESNQSLNSIDAIVQTNDRYLWFGTNNGLYRYDGVHFTIYNVKNRPALLSNTINALVEDHSGRLWIGTGKGLTSYKDGIFTDENKNSLLKDVSISSLCVDDDNNLFLGTQKNGLLKISKDKKVSCIWQTKGKESITFCYYHNHILWFGQNGIGLIKYREDKIDICRPERISLGWDKR